MGACYSHIDFKERVKLFDLAKAGILSIDEIARMLGRHRSTIYREISRNYHSAQTSTPTARLIRYKALRDYVLSRLRLGWSPEQIAGRLKAAISSTLEGKVCRATYIQMGHLRHSEIYRRLPNSQFSYG